jgi:hypothetical protein
MNSHHNKKYNEIHTENSTKNYRKSPQNMQIKIRSAYSNNVLILLIKNMLMIFQINTIKSQSFNQESLQHNPDH